ncbi:MAG: hypothetical protein JF597_03535 [Streptomyces sp.]|jgi:uncharacterized protein YukE|uniref:WXG100 family type VII secretion target n=1 Tax=Streptomyces sp. TaxID=1931 RepID=UPI0025E6FA1C|nr:hypothetical protein [Streptomyces sp.]MBW8792676.1 hypothetical protein [Streptomyces sp.]
MSEITYAYVPSSLDEGVAQFDAYVKDIRDYILELQHKDLSLLGWNDESKDQYILRRRKWDRDAYDMATDADQARSALSHIHEDMNTTEKINTAAFGG